MRRAAAGLRRCSDGHGVACARPQCHPNRQSLPEGSGPCTSRLVLLGMQADVARTRHRVQGGNAEARVATNGPANLICELLCRFLGPRIRAALRLFGDVPPTSTGRGRPAAGSASAPSSELEVVAPPEGAGAGASEAAISRTVTTGAERETSAQHSPSVVVGRRGASVRRMSSAKHRPHR